MKPGIVLGLQHEADAPCGVTKALYTARYGEWAEIVHVALARDGRLLDARAVAEFMLLDSQCYPLRRGLASIRRSGKAMGPNWPTLMLSAQGRRALSRIRPCGRVLQETFV